MELNDYIRILKRRWWIILVTTVLTAGAAFAFSKMQEPTYKSSVRLLITSRPDFGQTQAAQALIRDFSAWLRSSYRAEDVIDELQLDMDPMALLGDVTIAPATDSNLIQIDVENSDPNLANDIARVWGDQLIQFRNTENAGLREEDRIKAQFLDDPQAGLAGPNTKINVAAGAVFGFLLGVILVFILEWIESGIIRRSEDIERYLGIPVIGTIPK
ncbi:MAG: Wzz/FepE/Etk N-terminal domain-containing protein [Anaerolineae bacterium]|nr:Wzz/FepE/Etk N-terminal domain-containing protein [Anaerolineae bacterium]MCO5207992.1 Wzz/FepE/Etk N-terminal domain-containing protein [Anaerolineae bacterium]